MSNKTLRPHRHFICECEEGWIVPYGERCPNGKCFNKDFNNYKSWRSSKEPLKVRFNKCPLCGKSKWHASKHCQKCDGLIKTKSFLK